MIITKQKNFNELLQNIGSKPVFLVGCTQCATLCHTGGKDEVLALKEALVAKNIPVSGWAVLDPACHQMNERMLKDHWRIEFIRKVLVLPVAMECKPYKTNSEKEIIAGTYILFLGKFQSQIQQTVYCLVNAFRPLEDVVSQCPKSMLNGPCGGSTKGKCEINSNVECVWDHIIQELKKHGTLQTFSIIQKPKDWSKAGEMNRRI
jgi:hypothetical protein